jgi:hypothetical protein
MSAHRVKYYKHLMDERAMARNKEAEVKKLKKHNEDNVEVKPINVDEWDCPKPGTEHQRQILKHRKKLDKQKEDQVRKRLEKQEIDPNYSGTTPR